MNLEKVVFGFFIVLALTLNVAFVLGGPDNPQHHSIWILFAAVAVNLVATALKLGDRSQVGALLLATALVADLQLVASALIWTFADAGTSGMAPAAMVSIVSLAAGALVANVVSVTIVVSDTLLSSR
ncbi:MAG: DUF6394 family protein [Gammaproteobacteria bacterium]|nr:DUF6394 family protein [Gammaproteobacteria bacterium]